MYQLIIIGAGPAGQTAGIYTQRYGIKFLIIGQILGGTTNEAHLVDNYPGFKSISGPDLAKEFQKHLNVETKEEQVEKISKDENGFKVTTNKEEYQGQSLILGMGMKIRKLNFKNEEVFLNKGISYCTSANTSQFKNKTLAVVGGGDSALTNALKLADQAKRVYLIHRRDEFRGSPALVKKAQKEKNIEIIYSAQVTEAQGKDKIEKLILNTGQELDVDQVFIDVGGIPNVHLCGELNIEMENSFVKVNKNQETNIPGIFAAGDITNNPLKQIVTAAAEGSIAATSVYKYLKNINS
ncbi:NAD(P)/FAD-dependent oxidoreductase [Patescibacteria group bacterium]|nr:NAD(P)/FAD-dependent oxidoreductase [Patescibacteria group bacterium]MBU1563555.1 NAD(P)/FAD-dependent oxidoreductase [Patescibacteria group bacterium]MBU2068203.1 NAD(P)/FAD-dependent oxidoreductase [Patescibacteria group bacterium]